jgi:hypothetical protein
MIGLLVYSRRCTKTETQHLFKPTQNKNLEKKLRKDILLIRLCKDQMTAPFKKEKKKKREATLQK